MKKIITVFSLITSAALIVGACTETKPEQPQEQIATEVKEEAPTSTVVQPDTIKKSIPSEAKGSIGSADISISYHSPGVKGRVIWGGLVPYDQVWVTGAHKATAVEFSKAVIIDGQEVPTGKYALFTIPGREEWTIILNKDYEQHLADNYDQKKDVVRVKVKPSALPQLQERLKYTIKEQEGTKGVIEIAWEKVGVALPVESKS